MRELRVWRNMISSQKNPVDLDLSTIFDQSM